MYMLSAHSRYQSSIFSKTLEDGFSRNEEKETTSAMQEAWHPGKPKEHRDG